MIVLNALKPQRIALDLKRSHLAAITTIPEDRIRELELRLAEPWFDEALHIHRALGVSGINDLFVSGYLTDCDLSPLDDDLPAWKSGTRAPLSLALRIAARFGLSDPALLATSPLLRQLWEVLVAGERHPEAPGWCTWCGADIFSGEDHLPTCLPHNLLGTCPPTEASADVPRQRPAKRAPRERGIPAYGLRALREDRELLQKDVAAVIGIHPNHYARVERADLPLTPEAAKALAEFYGVDQPVLYTRPEGAQA